jgi:tetratricopeptide (TPR) repeat protein
MLYNKDVNGDWKRQHYYKPTRAEFAREARYGCKYDPAFRRGIENDLQYLDLRVMFRDCPIPILVLEGRHDLTWGADKVAKFHSCFPGSRLVVFETSAHAPFADEPDTFFAVLREFLRQLPSPPADVTRWKRQIADRQASPEYLLATSRGGQASSEKIAGKYSIEWLPRLSDADALLRLGFALYDVKRYSDALKVFGRMQEVGDPGLALVWQGHMLDLLGQRTEAVAAYQKALAAGVKARHDQYGLVLNKAYVEERLRSPFPAQQPPNAE